MTNVNAVLTAPDEEAMVACGARLAAVLPPGTVVHLVGELGMGKTPSVAASSRPTATAAR